MPGKRSKLWGAVTTSLMVKYRGSIATVESLRLFSRSMLQYLKAVFLLQSVVDYSCFFLLVIINISARLDPKAIRGVQDNPWGVNEAFIFVVPHHWKIS